jgi:hypothetical protein
LYTVEFAVADIEEIKWFSAPFDCLTLSDKQRETIMAVIETETSYDPDYEFDDFVNGKGRGVIVLLQYDTPIVVFLISTNM